MLKGIMGVCVKVDAQQSQRPLELFPATPARVAERSGGSRT
jgi:hypothetical protein